MTIAICFCSRNSILHIPSTSVLLLNMGMATSKELRLENLRALVTEFKTADAVAQLAGTAPMYLSQILNGAKSSTGRPRGVGDALARKLEQGCGKDEGWMDRPHSTPSAAAQAFDENVAPAPMGSRPIPVISAVQAGVLKDMENPYEPGDGFAVEYTDDIKLSQWTFGLEVEGDSMLPRFRPGDRVIVDPEVAPNPGNFVVARNGSNQATLKKYRPRGMDTNGNTVFELVPLNDDYPTLRSDIDHLLVIGVVVELRQKMR